MNKFTLLFFTSFCLSFLVHAQNNIIILDSNSTSSNEISEQTIVNYKTFNPLQPLLGGIISCSELLNDESDKSIYQLYIKNNSSLPKQLMIKKTSLNVNENTRFQVCYNEVCHYPEFNSDYPTWPAISQNTISASFNPGEMKKIEFYHEHFEICDSAKYKLDVYNVNDTSENTFVNMVFHYNNTQLGIASNSNPKIEVYPNPAIHGKFYINYKNLNEKPHILIIKNLLGQTIIQKSLFNEDIELNLSYVKKGIYVIELYSNKYNIIDTSKIVIN